MTNSICVDLLFSPISSKLKSSTDANKNAIKNNKKKDNNQDYESMNEILIFLFR